MPGLNRICTLYKLKEANRFSLVKMIATDRNTLAPFERDLEYTIEMTSVRNISAIPILVKTQLCRRSCHTFLGWNYCGAALCFKVPLRLEKKPIESLFYDLQADLESVNSLGMEGNRYL